MHLLILILTHENVKNRLVREFAEQGMPGCTIIESTGMANVINNDEDAPMFGIIRHIMNGEDEKEPNFTLLLAMPDDTIPKAKAIIHDICGDLNVPNAGILLSLPIDAMEGVGGQK